MTQMPQSAQDAVKAILVEELTALYDRAVLAGATPTQLRTTLEDRARRLRERD